MPYTPENNPYIPGDPYSYDLKWIISQIKTAISLYEPLNSKFDTLYDYVHDYFDNLDVTQEVYDKIDQMAADGELDDVINAALATYFDVLTDPAARKYVFIGSSYNAAAHHGGWASKLYPLFGLTEGVNAWNSADPGAGFANGRFLSQLTTVASSMSSEQKASITDIVIVGAINDWSASVSAIGDAVTALETYARSTMPHARLWIILGEWSYENATIRTGAITAYNIIISSVRYARVIDNAYVNFMIPTYLESDRCHPTELGMNLLTRVVANVLNEGSVYIRKFTDLTAVFAAENNITVKGELTPAGMHVWKCDNVGANHLNNTINIPGPGNWVTVATASTTNYLFEDSIEFEARAMYRIGSSFKSGRCRAKVVYNNGNWDLMISSTEIATGQSDYPINSVTGVYLTFDTILPIWGN